MSAPDEYSKGYKQTKKGRIQAQMSRDMHKGLEDTAERRAKRLELGKSAAKNLTQGTRRLNKSERKEK